MTVFPASPLITAISYPIRGGALRLATLSSIIALTATGCSFVQSKFPGFSASEAEARPTPEVAAPSTPDRYTGGTQIAQNATFPGYSRDAGASGRLNTYSPPSPSYGERAAQQTRQRHEQTLRALDATPGLTNVSFWERLSRDFHLPRDHPEVKRWAHHYAAQGDRIREIFARGEPYVWQIEQRVRQRGMPLELVLLPALESGYNPHAVSRSKAVGLWQFLPASGERFGLRTSWWFDGRRDFIASTGAALDYMDFLYGRFDDWLIAIASYNCGEGCMSRALASSRSFDFWNTRLPKETSEYVPKLLAMAELISNPSQYGFYVHPLPDGPQTEIVTIPGQMDLQKAATLSGADITRLKALNSGLRRNSTPPTGPHRLVVPKQNSAALQAALGRIPKAQLVSAGNTGGNHRVQRGDTLNGIAQRYGTRPDAIQRANNLNGHLIKVGQMLVVPGLAPTTPQTKPAPKPAVRPTQASYQAPTQPARSAQQVVHQVAAGDTLWYISQLYGVSSQHIAAWNQLAPNAPLQLGQRLRIFQQTNQPVAANEDDAVFYQVRAGDSLTMIANRFGVSVNEIMQWNILHEHQLRPGQRLKILTPRYGQAGI